MQCLLIVTFAALALTAFTFLEAGDCFAAGVDGDMARLTGQNRPTEIRVFTAIAVIAAQILIGSPVWGICTDLMHT